VLAALTSYHGSSFRQQEETMAFLVWIVLGLTSGFVGSQLANSRWKGVPDMLIGLAGALAGGWLFYVYGPPSVTGLNLGSYYAAMTASLAVLLIYYALRRI
jgi:uncharacterized membrane protein YeaQ/YmgE (transglycosylase-associated protein family)